MLTTGTRYADQISTADRTHVREPCARPVRVSPDPPGVFEPDWSVL